MSVAKSGKDDRNCGATNSDVIHRAICRLVALGRHGRRRGRQQQLQRREPQARQLQRGHHGLGPGRHGRQARRPRRHAVLLVGHVRRDDTFANFCNYGGDVDLIAPGKCIWSTLPGNRYGYISGHVHGRAARHRGGGPVQGVAPARDAGAGPGRAPRGRDARLEHRHGPGLDPRAAARRLAPRRRSATSPWTRRPDRRAPRSSARPAARWRARSRSIRAEDFRARCCSSVDRRGAAHGDARRRRRWRAWTQVADLDAVDRPGRHRQRRPTRSPSRRPTGSRQRTSTFPVRRGQRPAAAPTRRSLALRPGSTLGAGLGLGRRRGPRHRTRPARSPATRSGWRVDGAAREPDDRRPPRRARRAAG